VSVDVPSQARARFRLGGSDEDLLAAVDLARREKECCAFFDFSVEVGTDACWLVAGVPDEAAPLLADLVQLAQSTA
jgi:hypothetical protein